MMIAHPHPHPVPCVRDNLEADLKQLKAQKDELNRQIFEEETSIHRSVELLETKLQRANTVALKLLLIPAEVRRDRRPRARPSPRVRVWSGSDGGCGGGLGLGERQRLGKLCSAVACIAGAAPSPPLRARG